MVLCVGKVNEGDWEVSDRMRSDPSVFSPFLLGAPAIITAILDRILHRAETIHLNGKSYG